MKDQPFKPVEGPAAWTREDVARETDWIRHIEPAEADELGRAVRGAMSRGLSLVDLSPETFPLPLLQPKLEDIAREVEDGRGMVQIRGVPVDRYSPEENKMMIWGIGTYLGTGLSQSLKGDYLGEVTDLGVQGSAADGRNYRSKGLSRFHTDRCDVVGLLCVVRAMQGGESRVVSSATVHNEILRRRPDLLEVLYGDFHHSRQGEQTGDEGPHFKVPIFAFENGRFTSQLSFLYMESAQRFPDVPTFTDKQREALALVSEIANEQYAESEFLPGDLQLLNGHVTWHCRAGYEDHEEPERRRLLYRLWLSTPSSRALPESYRDSWGEIAPGAIRGGVTAAEGWRAPCSGKGAASFIKSPEPGVSVKNA